MMSIALAIRYTRQMFNIMPQQQDDDKVIMWIFGGRDHLYSVDPNSNFISIFIRVYGLERYVDVKTCRFSIGVGVPLIKVQDKFYHEVNDIVRYLKMYVAHGVANTRMETYLVAYQSRLYNLVLFNNWAIERNAQFSLNVYMEQIQALIGSVFGRKIRTAMEATVEEVVDYNKIEDKLFWLNKEAHDCFATLSVLLGTKPYVMGDYCSIVDAMIVGYLGPMVHLQYPEPVLRNILRSYENLYAYVIRVNGEYYVAPRIPSMFGAGPAGPGGPGETEPQTASDSPPPKPTTASTTVAKDNERASWPLMLTAGTVAAIAMGGYAYFKGIIRL